MRSYAPSIGVGMHRVFWFYYWKSLGDARSRRIHTIRSNNRKKPLTQIRNDIPKMNAFIRSSRLTIFITSNKKKVINQNKKRYYRICIEIFCGVR